MANARSILVSSSEGVAWAKLTGKASFENSSDLKSFFTNMIKCGYYELVLDLKECPLMDSTFMGMLTSIAQKLVEAGRGNLHIINLNERNMELLSNLGIDQLFAINPNLTDLPALPAHDVEIPLASTEQSKADYARIMYEAHQALSDISPDNASKFKDVLEYLRQDIEQDKSL